MTLAADVALYVEGAHELAVVAPIGAELERRGAAVRVTADLDEPAEVGVYACHGNRLFDHDARRWRRPPNEVSAVALHDLGQNGLQDIEYFTAESWHVFDLGLLPGPDWMRFWQRARDAGARGPTLGMQAIGWPKLDHTSAPAFGADVERLRAGLGAGRRAVVLLACSWSDRRQLGDALATVDPAEHRLVVKYPVSGPPPPGSPWHARLAEAYAELLRARDLASATPQVAVADDDADIMALLSAADVVLSNGSNVLYEGILCGVPGVSIRDWVHPAGPGGEQEIEPRVDLGGVLCGRLGALPAMLQVVREPAWDELVAASAGAIIDPATRGHAAALAADAIEAAVRRRAALGPEGWAAARELAERPVAGTGPTLHDQLVAAQDALERSAERERRAAEQLHAYEEQLGQLRAGTTRR